MTHWHGISPNSPNAQTLLAFLVPYQIVEPEGQLCARMTVGVQSVYESHHQDDVSMSQLLWEGLSKCFNMFQPDESEAFKGVGADPKSVDVAIFAPTIHIPAAQVLVGEAGAGMSCKVGRIHGSGDDTHESRRWSKKMSMVINHSRT